MKCWVSGFEFDRHIGVRLEQHAARQGDRSGLYRPNPISRPHFQWEWDEEGDDPSVLRDLEDTTTMILGHREAREIYLAFDRYYRNLGQPPESDAKREGRLEATERHLADMRRLALRQVPVTEEPE